MSPQLISWLTGQPQEGPLASNPIEVYTAPLPQEVVNNMDFIELVNYERCLGNYDLAPDEPWVSTEPIAE